MHVDPATPISGNFSNQMSSAAVMISSMGAHHLKHRCLTSWILLGTLLAASAGEVQEHNFRSRVDSVFAAWNNSNSPGCAVGVDLRGDTIMRAGYGQADLEHSAPWTSRTPGYIGSAVKQFEAFIIVLLEQRGRLSLDDDIRRYVPEMPEYGHTITLRQLLHHTSGIRDFPSMMYYAGFGRGRPYGDREISDMILRQRQLLFTPGTDVSYSTSGYWLLSLIVERVAGRPWAEVVRDEVFGPLEMSETFFQSNLSTLVPGRSLGYQSAPDGGFRLYERAFVTNTSLFMSVDDLLRWAANFSHARVGGEIVLSELRRPGVLSNGDTIPEAPGLVIEDYDGRRMISHNGRNAGHTAELIRFPELQLSIAVLCNVREASAPRFARRIADLALPFASKPPDRYTTVKEQEGARAGAEDDESLRQATPPASPENRKAQASWRPSAAQLAEVLGDYVRGENVFKVSASAEPATVDLIEVRFNDGADIFGLAPLQARVFQLTGPAADPSETVEFVESSSGVPSLIYDSGSGAALEFTRVPAPTDSDLAVVGGSFHSPDLDVTYIVRLDGEHLAVRIASPLASPVFPRGLFRLGGLQWTDGAGTRIAFYRKEDGSTTMTVSDPRVGDLEFVRADTAVP